jgi:hypothetical protein
MQFDTPVFCTRTQPLKVKLAILVREKNRLSINTTLDNVLRDTKKMDTWTAGHSTENSCVSDFLQRGLTPLLIPVQAGVQT